MSVGKLLLLGIMAGVLVAGGCATPAALRRHTVNQAQSLSEIQQQQVLDNLAKFVSNPHAIPDFAWPNAGSTQVTDGASGNLGLGFDAAGFASAALGGGGSREAQVAWTLQPVNDPRRLELMRCAYQKAVWNCGKGGPNEACPNCEAAVEAFYDPQHRVGPISEIANYDCITPGCCVWFAYGPKDKVPKNCCLVGHYCDTYVWILPGGEDEFAKLTLAILDFAVNDPMLVRQKLVLIEYGLDANNKRDIVSWKEMFEADVDDPLIDATQESPAGELPPPGKSAAPGQQPKRLPPAHGPMLSPRNQASPQQRSQSSPSILEFRQRLNTLAPE